MGAGPDSYHLAELAIARSPDDPRRIMPPINDAHRRILDVGCGAGQTLIASECAGKTACGVDVDLTALRLGRRLSQDMHLVCSTGEALPFSSDCFDLVIARVALPYMRIPVAVAEFNRVSKPRGMLWLVLHPAAFGIRRLLADLLRLRLRSAAHQLYVVANTVIFHLSGRLFPLPIGERRYESCQTRRGITLALQRAGYEDVETTRHPFLVVTAYKRSRLDARSQDTRPDHARGMPEASREIGIAIQRRDLPG